MVNKGKVFKIPNDIKKEYDRLIGCYASKEMDALVTLVALNRNISRSALLRIIISDWFKSRNLKKENIFSSIVERASLIYTMSFKKVGEEEKSLELFKKQVSADLLSRSVPEEYVSQILSKLDAKEKNTSEAE